MRKVSWADFWSLNDHSLVFQNLLELVQLLGGCRRLTSSARVMAQSFQLTSINQMLWEWLANIVTEKVPLLLRPHGLAGYVEFWHGRSFDAADDDLLQRVPFGV